VDPAGRLLADSAALGPRLPAPPAAAAAARYAEPPPRARSRLLYRLGAALYRIYEHVDEAFSPPEVPAGPDVFYAPGRPLLGREVQEALAGRYGAATRTTRGGQRSLTLYSALPVASGGKVVGAVLVTQSTYRILRQLYEVRLDVFRIFLGSLAAAALLSLFL